MLAKVVNETQSDWSEHIPFLTFSYNACANKSTSLSPFFLMTGQNPKWNIDLILDNPPTQAEYDNLSLYARDLVDRLERAHHVVRYTMQSVAYENSRWYNRSVRQRQFEVGDSVRIFVPRHVQGRSFYKDVGVVRKKLNDATFIIHCPSWREDRVVHVDKLRPVNHFYESDHAEVDPSATSVIDNSAMATANDASTVTTEGRCDAVRRCRAVKFFKLVCKQYVFLFPRVQENRQPDVSVESGGLTMFGCPLPMCLYDAYSRKAIFDHIGNHHRLTGYCVRQLNIVPLTNTEKQRRAAGPDPHSLAGRTDRFDRHRQLSGDHRSFGEAAAASRMASPAPSQASSWDQPPVINVDLLNDKPALRCRAAGSAVSDGQYRAPTPVSADQLPISRSAPEVQPIVQQQSTSYRAPTPVDQGRMSVPQSDGQQCSSRASAFTGQSVETQTEPPNTGSGGDVDGQQATAGTSAVVEQQIRYCYSPFGASTVLPAEAIGFSVKARLAVPIVIMVGRTLQVLALTRGIVPGVTLACITNALPPESCFYGYVAAAATMEACRALSGAGLLDCTKLPGFAPPEETVPPSTSGNESATGPSAEYADIVDISSSSSPSIVGGGTTEEDLLGFDDVSMNYFDNLDWESQMLASPANLNVSSADEDLHTFVRWGEEERRAASAAQSAAAARSGDPESGPSRATATQPDRAGSARSLYREDVARLRSTEYRRNVEAGLMTASYDINDYDLTGMSSAEIKRFKDRMYRRRVKEQARFGKVQGSYSNL